MRLSFNKIIVLIFSLSALIASLSFSYNQIVNTKNNKVNFDNSSLSLDVSYYQDLFRSLKELSFGEPEIVDITGDGKDELVFINIAEGCASCHDHYLHIFNGKSEIFSIELDDPTFVPIKRKGFIIYEPIRKDSEPYCCPTSFKQRFFEWDGVSFSEQE
jgi:hypothetical protein